MTRAVAQRIALSLTQICDFLGEVREVERQVRSAACELPELLRL